MASAPMVAESAVHGQPVPALEVDEFAVVPTFEPETDLGASTASVPE